MSELSDGIDRLLPTKRGKGRLSPAPGRENIPAEMIEAQPTAADPLSSSGVSSPLTEDATYTPSGYHAFTDQTGQIVIVYPSETRYVDGDGREVIIVHAGP